jgi:chromosomal replication initiation ATPase DnaA
MPQSATSLEPPTAEARRATRKAGLLNSRRAGQKLAIADLVKKSGVPDRHLAKVCECRASTGTPWAAAYASLRGRLGEGFLVALLGARGPGKTQLAACLAVEVCERLNPALYIRAADLFDELRAGFKDSGTTNKFKSRVRRVKFLVIDELQEAALSDYERRELTGILDHRYGAQLDTVLISNVLPEVFNELVGSSVMSRLTETGGIIVADWPSFRKPLEIGGGK